VSPERNLRVLVVDDHDVVHWGFRLLLTEQPWVERCLSASNAEEALELTRRYDPHVALVDLFLGEESGAELCEAIRRESPTTRVLLISGAGWISPQAAKAAGATVLRGDIYKPRTSPYSFQGLGERGLEILVECRRDTGLPIIVEVVDVSQVGRVAEIAEGRAKEGGFVGVDSLLKQTVERIDELFKSEGDITGISTGLDELDQRTSGWQPGELVILAARPSMGKTALALNFIESAMLSQDRPTLVFSMEMPSDSLVMRMLSSIGRIDQGRIRNLGAIDYRIPTSMDLPGEMVSEIVKNGDGPGPYGAKGMSEGALLCVAAAVGSAVTEATGVVIRERSSATDPRRQ